MVWAAFEGALNACFVSLLLRVAAKCEAPPPPPAGTEHILPSLLQLLGLEQSLGVG